ncbi:helix-turn-helix domain-containing protein [Kitasatospora gansuensis]
MTTTELQRKALSSFLRTRRARLTPEQVGLAPGVRRRTPGLRREELALLAGVGVTWYTWLEQGRRINPSPRCSAAWPAPCGWTGPRPPTCSTWWAPPTRPLRRSSRPPKSRTRYGV